MSNSKLFISARWENLILISYKVKPEFLNEYLPKGLELDTIEGNAFISLAAFSFLDTKVKGIKIPFHVNFPEINLRFYVKEPGEVGRRGVVFIREFVPRFMIPVIANALYNENYRTARMNSEIEFKHGKVFLSHTIRIKGKQQSLKIEAEDKLLMPPESSTEHFFKEHEWGFGKTKKGETLVYRVEHPFWEVYPVANFDMNFNFAEVYGEKWKILDNQEPFNVIFAKGSAVKIFPADL
jgi:uncharacterized protein